MELTQALLYAGDVLADASESRWSYIALAGAILLFAASFVMGEEGVRIRRGFQALFIFTTFGAIGTLAVIAVKGVPAPEALLAPAKGSQDDLLDRIRERAQDAQRRPRNVEQPGEKAERPVVKRDIPAERRQLERKREQFARAPEASRTPETRRGEATTVRNIARLDRDDGRLESAIETYKSAISFFERIGDPNSQRAVVTTTLDMAEALDARGRERDAREAYRRAITAQRGLGRESEPEQRGGMAGALLRYASFEADHRQDITARAALDEADGYYAALREQRGKLDVLSARTALEISLGNFPEARRQIAAMRELARGANLPDAGAEIDLVEAWLELADGRTAAAAALFDRAAVWYAARGQGPEPRRRLAIALLGRAEAAYALKDLPLARKRVAVALEIYRAQGERSRAVAALARVSLWEIGAGDPAAAEGAFASAVAMQRESGERKADSETESVFALLCIGALHTSPVCREREDPRAN